jgi:NADPH:quinone reductase-like Zn-dependent oxidoreductase
MFNQSGSHHMKSIIQTQYGSPDILQLKDVNKPTPKEGEVLVKIHATGLNIRDWYILTGSPFITRFFTGGVRKPKTTTLGADIAGRVEAVGSQVTQFRVGDSVFGDISDQSACGFAEYATAPEKALVHKPDNITFEEAAAVPMAAVTALQGLRKGGVQAGQKVLVNGASGGVGTFAVQIAKALGAEVTAVCSTSKVDMVRAIGADHVIDYTREDFSRNGQRYDLILAANGNRSLLDYRRALKPNGIYICAGGNMPQIFAAMLLGPLVSKFGNKQLGNVAANSSQPDLLFLADLLQSGKIAPVMDGCYPLEQTSEAFRHLGSRHARGKVVVTVAN